MEIVKGLHLLHLTLGCLTHHWNAECRDIQEGKLDNVSNVKNVQKCRHGCILDIVNVENVAAVCLSIHKHMT